jgi:hypothetical protein
MPDKPRCERLKADALSFGYQGLSEGALEYYHEAWACYKRSAFADMDMESFTPNPDEVIERRARLHSLRALGIYDDTLVYWFMVDELLDVKELEKTFPYDERRFDNTSSDSGLVLNGEVESYFWKRLREVIRTSLLDMNIDPILADFVKNEYSPDDLKRLRSLKKNEMIKHIKGRMKKWIAEE